MTPFMRRAHIVAIAFQAASLALYGYLYASHPSDFLIAMMGWSVFFGAYSTRALRKARKPGVLA